jgi:hypothetical protein
MMQYTKYKTSCCHWQMLTNARQITMVEVELNLDPHSRHIYMKEVNFGIFKYMDSLFRNLHIVTKTFTPSKDNSHG